MLLYHCYLNPVLRTPPPPGAPPSVLLLLKGAALIALDVVGTRSSKRTHNLQYCQLHQTKNQILGVSAPRQVCQKQEVSLAPCDIISSFSWCGAEFCCNFSVISFLGSRSRPHLENFRQSVCCLFEYGRKPMHARVKWSDQVRCLIFSLVLPLFRPSGVSRAMSPRRLSTVHVRVTTFLLNKCCCCLSGW